MVANAGELTLSAVQSVADYTIQITGQSSLTVLGAAMLNDAQVTFADYGNNDFLFFDPDANSQVATLGANFVATITAGTDVIWTV